MHIRVVPVTSAGWVFHHLQLTCEAPCIAQEGRRAVGSYRKYHDIMRDLLRGMCEGCLLGTDVWWGQPFSVGGFVHLWICLTSRLLWIGNELVVISMLQVCSNEWAPARRCQTKASAPICCGCGTLRLGSRCLTTGCCHTSG